MSKSQAREKLEGEIAKLGKQPLNGDKSMVNGAVTFGWFVLHRYLPLKEADWRDETAKVKKHLIQADLVDEFGDVRLENFDKFTLQTHLNKLAKTRSRDRVLQIRSYIKAIFAEAVDQDFLPKDPARTLKTPANLRETDKTVLSWEQLAAALARLGLRDRILLKLDMTNALRPSELFAFRWKCHRVEAVLAHHCGDDLQGEDSVLRKDKRKSDRGADCKGPLRRSRRLAGSQPRAVRQEKEETWPAAIG